MFTFEPKTGKLSCADSPFESGEVIFDLNEFTLGSSKLGWDCLGNSYIAKTNVCKIELIIDSGNVRVFLENSGDSDVFLKEIRIVFAPQAQPDPPRSADYLELIHGRTFGDACGVKKVGLITYSIKADPESCMIYVLHERRTGKSFLFSTLPPHAGDFVSFKALHELPHCEGRFGVLIRSEQQRLIKPGEKASSSPVQCRAGSDPLEMLEELGKEWNKNRNMPMKDLVTGWNSWDYYAGAVCAEDLYENQHQAQKLFPGKVKFIVIDEGYEPRWGNWTANWKFPEGLGEFCKKVKAEDGVPGVWTAPLMVNSYTQLYREHPDWFGLAPDGQNLSQLLSYGPMASLDVTNPEAREWLRGVFRELRQAGFELFKVDFTQMVLQCSSFRNRTVPRGQIIRIAFETIREAIGPDAYLLACGAPFESVTGIVDGVRISGDIHNYWGHILRNSSEFSTRWWMNRQLWNNDPDFLIVRGSGTSDDPNMNRRTAAKPFQFPPETWLSGRIWNLDEAKVYALLIFLTGGDIVLGDRLDKLNQQGLDLLKPILDNPLKTAARPLDLFEKHGQIPRLWLAKEADRNCLGVFNWSEDPETITLDLEELGLSNTQASDFWTSENVAVEAGKIVVNLSPRSCRGLVFV